MLKSISAVIKLLGDCEIVIKMKYNVETCKTGRMKIVNNRCSTAECWRQLALEIFIGIYVMATGEVPLPDQTKATKRGMCHLMTWVSTLQTYQVFFNDYKSCEMCSLLQIINLDMFVNDKYWHK